MIGRHLLMYGQSRGLSRRDILKAGALGTSTLLFSSAKQLRAIDSNEAPDLAPMFEDGPPISEGWRQRLDHPQLAPLVAVLKQAAKERAADPLPSEDVRKVLIEGAPTLDVNDPRIQRYVTAGAASAAVGYYLPMLALAFQLTRNESYRKRALDWMDAAISWPRWDGEGPGRGDIGSAYVVKASVLGVKWLGDEVIGEKRRAALHAAWIREGKALGKWTNVTHSNNHPWFCRAGLGFLVATHPECFDDPKGLLEKLIQTFREALQISFSEQGEYHDGLVYALKMLTSTFLFAQALWDRHRIRLFNDRRLMAFVDFCFDNTAPDGGNLPDDHEMIPGWHWQMGRPVVGFLAATYGDNDLKARLRGSLADTDRWQRGTKLWFWLGKNIPNATSKPQSTSYWHGIYDLMWSNPIGPTKEMFANKPRVRSYQNTGYCIAREGQLGEKTMLWFRAGSANQKDLSNHNGFVWYPMGRRVIDTPRSDNEKWRDHTFEYFKDWNSFFNTSRAANVILVDGRPQKAVDPNGWPGQADKEWLHRGKVPTTSKIVSKEELKDGVRWVGEAQHAYPDQLHLWRRTLELRNWLTLSIADQISCVKPDSRVDWLLHTPGDWQKSGSQHVVSYQDVRVEAEFISPSGLEISIERTPEGQDGRRTSYLRASTVVSNGRIDINVILRASRT
jgi:hypothetical protein